MYSHLQRKRRIWIIAAAFMAPAVILYVGLVLYPIIYSAFLSFNSWEGVGDFEWVGLKNFNYLMGKDDFWQTFGNTMQVTVLSMLIQVPLGLLIAYLLFRTKSKVFKVYRAVNFLPVVIASTAIGTMFRIILNNDIGVFNTILSLVGLGGVTHPWLSDVNVVLYTVIFVQIWQYIGTYIIIFLAAMQSIDAEVFESAVIDGANCVQQFTHVACPLVKETIKVALVLCFTGSMKSFDIPYIMTAGGPGYASSYLGNFMYNAVFSKHKFGRGSAVTVIILLVSFGFTILFNLITRERQRGLVGGELK